MTAVRVGGMLERGKIRVKKQTILIVLLLLLLPATAGIPVFCAWLSRKGSPVAQSRDGIAQSVCEAGSRPRPPSLPRRRTLLAAEDTEDSQRIAKKNIYGEKWKSKILSLRNSAILRTSAVKEDAKSALEKRVAGLLAGEHAPRQVLVRFLPGAGREQIDAVIEKLDTVRVKRLHSKADAIQGALYQLYLAWTVTVADALRMLLGEPVLRYAEPNYIGHAAFEPNDYYYVWGDLWGLTKIGAPSAWDRSTGQGVVVAVIDTGCDYGHEDLADNIWNNSGETGAGRETNGIDDDGNGYTDDWRGWDFAYYDNDPYDSAISGHGTYVSGVVAAVGDNGVGVVGLAFDAKIMMVKALDDIGDYYTAEMVEAIHYAVDNGASVINISAGGTMYTQAIRDATVYARMNDCVIAAAAGNDDSSVAKYPAAYDSTIAVGATEEDDSKRSTSAFGNWLDVFAPGGDIISSEKGGGYSRVGGTSMASPHVAGLAALMLAKRPNLTFTQVRDLIRSTAVDLGDPGRDDVFGYGRIDAAAALDKLFEPRVTITSVTPADGVVGPTVWVTIAWESSVDSTYYVELGGDGTQGSGTQVDSGSCAFDTRMETTIHETDIADDSTQTVYIIVESGMQTATSRTEITDDHTPPVSAVTFPTTGSRAASVASISGTASDAGGSTVGRVRIYIFDGTYYYDPGSGFSSNSPVWLTASGTTSWSYVPGGVAWEEKAYTVKSVATDAVGNEGTLCAGIAFTIAYPPAVPPPPKTGGCALTGESTAHPAPASALLTILLLTPLLVLRRHRRPGSPG